MNTPPLVAIDFETYYEDGTSGTLCSIGACKGDYDAYCAHPRFHAYLVAIVCGDSADYVGPIEHAPWHRLQGATVVAHNAAFDAAVFRFLLLGKYIPAFADPDFWHCTATDPHAPKGRRSLADAAALHLGESVDKSPRASMAGRQLGDLSEAEQAALSEYCLNDARLARRLALKGVGMVTCTHGAIGAKTAEHAAADPVNRPAHYTAHPSGIECIQVTEHMGFNLGNAVKYIWRCDLKRDAIEDLEKARWYIDRELSKRRATADSTAKPEAAR